MTSDNSNDALLAESDEQLKFKDIEKLDGKSCCRIFGLLLMFGSGGYYFGYYMGIWNPLGEKYLRLVLKIDENDINLYYGLVNLMFAIGAAIGCTFGGVIADAIGRVSFLAFIDIFTVVVSAGYYVQKLWMLYIC